MKLSLAMIFLTNCTPLSLTNLKEGLKESLQAYLIVDFNRDVTELNAYTCGERMDKMIKLRGELMALKSELDAATLMAEGDEIRKATRYKNFLKFHRQK